MRCLRSILGVTLQNRLNLIKPSEVWGKKDHCRNNQGETTQMIWTCCQSTPSRWVRKYGVQRRIYHEATTRSPKRTMERVAQDRDGWKRLTAMKGGASSQGAKIKNLAFA